MYKLFASWTHCMVHCNSSTCVYIVYMCAYCACCNSSLFVAWVHGMCACVHVCIYADYMFWHLYKALLKTLKTGKIKSFLLENVSRLVSDNSGMCTCVYIVCMCAYCSCCSSSLLFAYEHECMSACVHVYMCACMLTICSDICIRQDQVVLAGECGAPRHDVFVCMLQQFSSARKSFLQNT